MFHRIFIILSLAVALVGCIDTVNIKDQLNETEKLVLYCRLCPQLDTISVYVTHTQLLYSSSEDATAAPIASALVQLSADNETWVDAVYDADKGLYLLPAAQLPIVEGRTYYIRASAAGLPSVDASCTVPYSYEVNFQSEIVAADHDNHGGEICDYPHYDVYYTWQDVAGEENYYAFGYTYSYDWDDDDWKDEKGAGDYPDGEFELQSMYFGDDYLEMISDAGCDGAQFRCMVEELDSPDEYEAPQWIFFLDKHNYLYHNSLNENDILVEFLLEPKQTYNNINGGFGLFSAFSMRTIGVRKSSKGKN